MIIRIMLGFVLIFFGSLTKPQAASKSFTATLLVRAPTSVSEVTPLTLGVLTQPLSSVAQFDLTSDGTTSTDLDDGFLGGHQTGKFRFTGESNSTLLISGTAESCDNTDITFNNVHLSSNEIILSDEGSGELDVGLNISLAAGITPASYSCAYTIEFLYQ